MCNQYFAVVVLMVELVLTRLLYTEKLDGLAQWFPTYTAPRGVYIGPPDASKGL